LRTRPEDWRRYITQKKMTDEYRTHRSFFSFWSVR